MRQGYMFVWDWYKLKKPRNIGTLYKLLSRCYLLSSRFNTFSACLLSRHYHLLPHHRAGRFPFHCVANFLQTLITKACHGRILYLSLTSSPPGVGSLFYSGGVSPGDEMAMGFCLT